MWQPTIHSSCLQPPSTNLYPFGPFVIYSLNSWRPSHMHHHAFYGLKLHDPWQGAHDLAKTKIGRYTFDKKKNHTLVFWTPLSSDRDIDQPLNYCGTFVSALVKWWFEVSVVLFCFLFWSLFLGRSRKTHVRFADHYSFVLFSAFHSKRETILKHSFLIVANIPSL